MFINSITFEPIERAVCVEFNKNPIRTFLENLQKAKNMEVSTFDTSMKMVAGAGFEPTTFGL